MAKTMRVAVSVGHNPDDPGASARSSAIGVVSEYGEMAPVAGLLVRSLYQHGVKAYLIGTGALEGKIREVNFINPDVAVELHLNAGGGDGAETLYCPGSGRGKLLAEIVNSHIVVATGEGSRGAKEGWYRMKKENGPDGFLSLTRCHSIITEAYFIDNAGDLGAYAGQTDYYQKLVEGIVAGLLEYRDKVLT